MSREQLYRLTLRGLALGFALFGALFLLSPDGTVRGLNEAGARLGGFAPAPLAAMRMWVSLSAAYMVLVTILAWMAQRDLRRFRHLLAILAAGKATSSLTALLYYALSSAAFAYLATFLVDGAIALVALGIWADVPRLVGRAAPQGGSGPVATDENGTSRPASTLHALIEAWIPPGGPFPEGASAFPVAEEVEAFVAEVGSRRTFRLLLGLLEFSPWFLPPLRMRRFSRVADRAHLVEAWERSRFWPRRRFLEALRLLALTRFYARPEVQAHLGYPPPLVRVPLGKDFVAEGPP